jgi:NNP family nitrate/nitrite transporter-like MFS transporter
MKPNSLAKADRINLLSFKPPHMRAFHITWMTFFVCFFGWFGMAPLMPIIREEFHLSKAQVGNLIIASVSITIFARLLIGWLCDKIGPRLTYTCLLLFGSLPVMFIGLSNSYESFIFFRLAIGVIGASFVITQFHTSVMFAPNIVGTANATVAGWGNLGGGITQMVMPLIYAGFMSLGCAKDMAWRYSMVVPGIGLLIMAFVYFFFTQDTPEGSILEQRRKTPEAEKVKDGPTILSILKDYRVWILFLVYGCCFGVEITIDNIAVLYFVDHFKIGLFQAGLIAGVFGMMNLFARALGGIFSDKASLKYNSGGRVKILGLFLLCEGLGMMLFSSMDKLPLAIMAMLLFAFFVKMSNGATYSIVPFINKKKIGMVSGIVGAGGNLGAVLFGFVFKSENISYQEGLFMIGGFVALVSFFIYLIKLPDFKITQEKKEKEGQEIVLA